MVHYGGVPLLFILLEFLNACSARSSHLTVCNTTECRDISRLLRALVDENQEPCNDFYKFACGKRSPDNPVESEIQESVVSYVQSRIGYAVGTALRKAILKDYTVADVPAAVGQAADLYAQCTAYNPTLAVAQMEVLSHFTHFAQWPLLTTNWTTKNFDLVDVAGRLKAYHGLNALVGLDLSIDVFNQQRKALYLGSADFDYDLSDYNASINPRFHDQYKLNISRALQQLVVNGVAKHMNTKTINKVAAEIVDFETSIALSAAPIPQNVLSPLDIFHPLSLDELNGVYNNTKVWHKFFRSAFRNDSNAMNWLVSHKVLVSDMNYFQALAEKIVGPHHAPLETVANYLMWRLLAKLSPFFDPEVFYVDKLGEEVNLSEKPEAKTQCFSDVKNTLPRTIDWLYVNAEGKKLDAKREPLRQVVRDLTVAAEQMINSSDWLNSEAKSRLLLKLSRMRTVIAYPDWLMNESRLNELYALKHVNHNSTYLDDWLSVSKWDYSELLETGEKFFFNDYSDSYFVVNAEYHPALNAFLIPAGIMEDTFFQPNYTAAFKYGLLGFIFAHEMFHGYDSDGIKYDENGVITNITDMLGDSEDEFEKRTNCVVEAYSKKCYPIKYKQTLEWAGGEATRLRKRSADEDEDVGDTDIEAEQYVTKKVCIDGERTLAENLADVNGLRAAWKAFKLAADRDDENDAANWRIDGLEQYTPSQLFFLSYATFFCNADQTSQLRSITTGEDGHSTDEARVNINLANFEPFAAAWKCKANSKMVKKATRRCRVF